MQPAAEAAGIGQASWPTETGLPSVGRIDKTRRKINQREIRQPCPGKSSTIKPGRTAEGELLGADETLAHWLLTGRATRIVPAETLTDQDIPVTFANPAYDDSRMTAGQTQAGKSTSSGLTYPITRSGLSSC